VLHSGDENGIARGLASTDAVERHDALGALVRRFTFSAPAELALLAVEHPQACRSYRGDCPLAEHLLRTLPISEELALAWRLALLEGDALRRAVRELDARVGAPARAMLARYTRNPDDAWQSFLARTLSNAGFRRTCFGTFAGTGALLGYLKTVLVRDAAPRPSTPAETTLPDGPACELPSREPRPDARAMRGELRGRIAEVLQDVADDPGLTFFLIQQALDFTPGEIARTFALKENLVRQRTFRFRERFRLKWATRYGERSVPFFAEEEA
jgi:DNA-directed RNA polymerase specialized sigma24 family protein